MTRTPAQIIADPDSAPAERIVARAYIRRLIISEADADRLYNIGHWALFRLDDTTPAADRPAAAETAVDTLITWRSPFGQWKRGELDLYPAPEQHTDVTDLTDRVRLSFKEVIDDPTRHDALIEQLGNPAVYLIRHIVTTPTTE